MRIVRFPASLIWVLFYPTLVLLSVEAFLPHRPSRRLRSRTWRSVKRGENTARRRPQRSPRPARSRSRAAASTPIQRAPHQFDHTKAEARPFVDALAEIQTQDDNEDCDAFDLPSALGEDHNKVGSAIAHPHVKSYGLDDLFPGLGFSDTFAASTDFRTALRDAIRRDVFDTTPTYHGLAEKARNFLLLPDSSLQGSWKCREGGWSRPSDTTAAAAAEVKNDATTTGAQPRMHRVTQVLQDYLGTKAPTGDVFMDTIGNLCGAKPTTHWMDIVGVLTRRIPHSWHQDLASNNATTVLLGFPAVDNYDGVGVFSHVVKLQREQWRDDKKDEDDVVSINEPVVFPTVSIDEEFILRPRFAKGKELIAYRDVDVLHSSPDIAYRSSVMRFM